MPHKFSKWDRATPEERFWPKVEKQEGGCWLWLSTITRDGYGHFWLQGKLVSAHRFAYELLVGPIPSGLTLDHLCRVRACVKPEHLEPVTVRDNVLRGNGHSALNAQKTQCPQGHQYDLFNTYLIPSGGRGCRACERSRVR